MSSSDDDDSSDEEAKKRELQLKRKREYMDDDEMFLLSSILSSNRNNVLGGLLSSVSSIGAVPYHRDQDRWESVSDFTWFARETKSYHFVAFFRFTPTQLEKIVAALDMPEFVPNVSDIRVPGITGFMIFLMR
jgi:hypothetical protein